MMKKKSTAIYWPSLQYRNGEKTIFCALRLLPAFGNWAVKRIGYLDLQQQKQQYKLTIEAHSFHIGEAQNTMKYKI